jgi:hypothetical protein
MMFFSRWLLAPAMMGLFFVATVSSSAKSSSFEVTLAEAQRLCTSPDHLKYEQEKFWPAMGRPYCNAMVACTQHAKLPASFDMVFVISRQGSIQRILYTPNAPIAACVAAQLRNHIVPSPPRDEWLISVHMDAHD